MHIWAVALNFVSELILFIFFLLIMPWPYNISCSSAKTKILFSLSNISYIPSVQYTLWAFLKYSLNNLLDSNILQNTHSVDAKKHLVLSQIWLSSNHLRSPMEISELKSCKVSSVSNRRDNFSIVICLMH